VGRLSGGQVSLLKVSEVTNVQTAIYFVGNYVGQRNEKNRLTNPILKSLFEEFIPNYPHILSALTRSSGRPPARAWTKQQAIDYLATIEASLGSSGIEEWLLYAVLLRYQKRSKSVTESSMAKAVARVMLERNCTAVAAAQYLVRHWKRDADQKGVNAQQLLLQYERHISKQRKNRLL